MTGPLSSVSRTLEKLVDDTIDWQVAMLRRLRDQMADALDREAMAAIEGARDWRDLKDTRSRYAD
jgi:hypothetical protein